MRNFSEQDSNSIFDFAEWGDRGRLRYARPKTRGRRLGTTVKDLLDRGLLEANTVLRPARKGVSVRAVVGASGELLVNGMPYKTPSGAAKAASGQRAESGWDFWVIDQGATSLADLRFRLLALERSRSAIEEKFEASIGNGLDGYYSIEANDERVIWRFGRRETSDEYERTPTLEEWARFWYALDRAGVWEWDPSYEDRAVTDGTYWHLIAMQDGKLVESRGANDYPPGFDRYCRAVSKLSGREFA